LEVPAQTFLIGKFPNTNSNWLDVWVFQIGTTGRMSEFGNMLKSIKNGTGLEEVIRFWKQPEMGFVKNSSFAKLGTMLSSSIWAKLLLRSQLRNSKLVGFVQNCVCQTTMLTLLHLLIWIHCRSAGSTYSTAGSGLFTEQVNNKMQQNLATK
jgi:hypothetical protein